MKKTSNKSNTESIRDEYDFSQGVRGKYARRSTAGQHSIEQMKLALKSENLAQLVFFIRGEKVMLAQDLAGLYGVAVRALNQAVKRNIKRFPADFMFQVTNKEFEALKSQI